MSDATPSRERTLLDQKEVYRQILDAIADMVLVKGAGSRILWANKAFRDYYGMTNEQLHERIDSSFNLPDFTEQYVRDDHYVYESGQVLNIPEEPVTRSDGVVQVFHTVKSPLRDDRGSVLMTVGVSRNITESKHVREELARHREHLEHLVEERTDELSRLSDELSTILSSLQEGIVAVDATGRVQLMNPAAREMLGVRPDEPVDKSIAELIDFCPEGDGAGVPAADLATVLANARATTGQLRSRRGDLRLVSMQAAPLKGAKQAASGMVLVLRDTALEREVADQRLRQQKLESVGLLAGGIAHDFNNILTGILANISIARIEGARGGNTDSLLEQAQQACLSAQSLTSQLLTFARGGAPVKRPLVVSNPVRQAAELALRGSGCGFAFDAAPDVADVEADEGQLVQAIGNLVMNARQAMPGGGEVSIGIDNAAVTTADNLPLAPGTYVKIVVRDQGCGIAREHLPRIFDPYFTTKSTGSGLGLASVHSIVKQHGGHVGVRSMPGAGAEFSVYLPASSSRSQAPEGAPSREHSSRRQRVMVLDDDEGVRGAMKLALSLLGHECVVVGKSSSAFEAVDAAQRDHQPFDAIFVDLTMPGDLAGTEVIARLVERKTGSRLIVMSGYSTDLVMANYLEHGLSARLQKPFTVDDIEEVLC